MLKSVKSKLQCKQTESFPKDCYPCVCEKFGNNKMCRNIEINGNKTYPIRT